MVRETGRSIDVYVYPSVLSLLNELAHSFPFACDPLLPPMMMTSMTPLQMTLICVRYQAQVSLLPRNTLRTLPFSRRRRRTTFLVCVFGRVKLPVACQPPSQVDRNCMWHLLVIDRPHLLNLISLIHIPHLIARQKSETGGGTSVFWFLFVCHW